MREPVKIKDLTEDYARQYVRAAIDDICKAHKRVNQMSDDERDDLAERIVRRKQMYTIGDISYFVDMLIGCELGDALKSVDIASIQEKLKEYDKQRNDALSVFISNEPHQEQIERRKPLTEWQKWHTYLGNDMTGIENWDAESYWYGIASGYEVEYIIMPIIEKIFDGTINKMTSWKY